MTTDEERADNGKELLEEILETLPLWGRRAAAFAKETMVTKVPEVKKQLFEEYKARIQENPEDSRNTPQYWHARDLLQTMKENEWPADTREHLLQYLCQQRGITDGGIQKLYAVLWEMHAGLTWVNVDAVHDSKALGVLMKTVAGVARRRLTDGDKIRLSEVTEKFYLDLDFQKATTDIFYLVLIPAVETKVAERPSPAFIEWLESSKEEYELAAQCRG